MNTLTRTDKERMKEYIDKMEPNEHSQILNIVKKYTDKFTKTQSGVLVSTETLTDDCLKEIDSYIHFSIDQRKRLDDDNKQRKNYARIAQ
jgi:hypothetical protein